MIFVLVRHAHAGDKKHWPHADEERPLTATGRQQAAGLVASVGSLGLRALYSSPYARCRQTLAPLASSTGLSVQYRKELAPDGDPADLDRMLADPRLDGSALCTHGETLSALFEHWATTGRLADTAPPGSTPKGAAWVVHTTGTHRTLRYVPRTGSAPARLDVSESSRARG